MCSVCSCGNVAPSKAWSSSQGSPAQVQGQYWIRSSLCCLEQPSLCSRPIQDSAVEECGKECFWIINHLCFTGHRLMFDTICQRHYHGQRLPDLLQSCLRGRQAPSQAGCTSSLVERVRCFHNLTEARELWPCTRSLGPGMGGGGPTGRQFHEGSRA